MNTSLRISFDKKCVFYNYCWQFIKKTGSTQRLIALFIGFSVYTSQTCTCLALVVSINNLPCLGSFGDGVSCAVTSAMMVVRIRFSVVSVL